ncbi:hypothetical protein BDN70DRAFT_960801 [Pholiota conissans]|uniref:Protein-S-isoprenylcysteine O-methyltransferase n=1 Tax=Pholiota conissans TaxID=109636 RepID=A0A9P6D4E1_9AGAR|nr:hypothetical protein BDN70DRAFT_960801 [Pholiota conissans]
MSLAKIPAIFLIGLAFNVSLTPPTPAAAKKDRVMGDGPVDMHYAMYLVKKKNRPHTGSMPSSSSPSSLPPTTSLTPKIYLSPTSILGLLSLLLGATIRALAYREMGRHFTFHVALLKDHRLVTTGPYAVVRHPGYTGGALSFLGMLLWYAARGAWMRESGVCGCVWAWPFLVPVGAVLCLPFASMWRRMPREDELLRKEFGREWEEWAANVRWRIVPYVY